MNKLAGEKSPYLLQHAENPVNWYPWGDEAFEKARREDKPVFLSIGYSTCHWCHVMAHESFEDKEVAAALNSSFVSIKVDREERPDIDAVYMAVCQALTGTGGWPLNVGLTADKKPFFAGTYFPKNTRFGRAGLLEIIPKINELWQSQRDHLLNSAEEISTALTDLMATFPGEELSLSDLDKVYDELEKNFDDSHAGFGGAPKFPSPHKLLFLLRYGLRHPEWGSLEMVEKTLTAMERGGIHDHLGGGFHRYSTDAEWRVPHFEKMLYDQALLALAYTEGYQVTGNRIFRETAERIFDYVLTNLTSEEGGFCSAEDADTEGVEGKHYVWTMAEIKSLLTAEEAEAITTVYNISEAGNHAEEATGEPNGTNILYMTASLEESAGELNIPLQELPARLSRGREKMIAARRSRPRPHKDDKVLTDWNGLMIAALATGGRAFGEDKYTAAAVKAAGFILSKMRDSDGRLLHRYRDGEAAVQSTSDDYAFLIWGLLELYESTFDASRLAAALELNSQLVEHYFDHVGGGFYLTAGDAEMLLVRQKESFDGATPSGNSVGMLNLVRLGHITGESKYFDLAAQISSALSNSFAQSPSSQTFMAMAVDLAIGPCYEVVVAGDENSIETRQMLESVQREFLPRKILLLRTDALQKLAPYTADQMPMNGKPAAYVCSGFKCEQPTGSPGDLLEKLRQ